MQAEELDIFLVFDNLGRISIEDWLRPYPFGRLVLHASRSPETMVNVREQPLMPFNDLGRGYLVLSKGSSEALLHSFFELAQN